MKNLFMLGALFVLITLAPLLAQAPTGFAQWLTALDSALSEPKEFAIIGDAGSDKLLEVVFGEYRPNQVVAFARDGTDTEIPLLAGRTGSDGHATVTSIEISCASCRSLSRRRWSES